MIESGEGIDWATGEALAFGCLLLEGHRVRLSGEDTQRGTFSQRHAVLVDQTNQNEYVPLNNIAPDQAKIEIYNSLLSERACWASNTATRWPIRARWCCGRRSSATSPTARRSSSTSSWRAARPSGCACRVSCCCCRTATRARARSIPRRGIERYLQLCAERNMCVCNLTTPANYFHALRRQLKRNFRKPLVVLTPKSLLRHKLAVSPLAIWRTAARSSS